MIEIREIQKLDIGGYVFVEGFPGVGLVGPMAISYMVQKLNMKYVGYIEGDDFPPLITIHNGKPLPPVRLYYSEKYKITSIFAEFTIPIELVHEISNKIYEYMKSKKIAKIISISGIPSSHVESDSIFAIASTEALMKDAAKAELSTITEGVSTGVSAMLLKNAITDTTSSALPTTIVLVPVEPSLIDPKCAELAITSINKLLGIKIEVDELEKEAKEAEAKMQELLKKSRETKDNYKRTLGSDSSMYA